MVLGRDLYGGLKVGQLCEEMDSACVGVTDLETIEVVVGNHLSCAEVDHRQFHCRAIALGHQADC